MPANAHTYEIVFSTIIVIYRVHRCCYFCCAAAFHCRHSFFSYIKVQRPIKSNCWKSYASLLLHVATVFAYKEKKTELWTKVQGIFLLNEQREEKIKNKKRNKWKEVDNNAADIWRRYKSKHFSKSAKWCYSTSKYLSSNPIQCTKTDERYFV